MRQVVSGVQESKRSAGATPRGTVRRVHRLAVLTWRPRAVAFFAGIALWQFDASITAFITQRRGSIASRTRRLSLRSVIQMLSESLSCAPPASFFLREGRPPFFRAMRPNCAGNADTLPRHVSRWLGTASRNGRASFAKFPPFHPVYGAPVSAASNLISNTCDTANVLHCIKYPPPSSIAFFRPIRRFRFHGIAP